MMGWALGLPFTGPTLAETCKRVRIVRKPMFGVFPFRHNPVKFYRKTCLPDPTDLLQSKRDSEHPRIHTPSPFFGKFEKGITRRGSHHQDPTKKITSYCLSCKDRLPSLPLHIASRPRNLYCFGGQVQVASQDISIQHFPNMSSCLTLTRF